MYTCQDTRHDVVVQEWSVDLQASGPFTINSRRHLSGRILPETYRGLENQPPTLDTSLIYDQLTRATIGALVTFTRITEPG
jgi:hypothetical protein